jgi:hypothetical protein
MKGRKTRKDGGPMKGVNDAAKDLADKPERRNIAPKIFGAAEERKRGGKTMGKMEGESAMHHAGRKPRKAGGRTGSNMSPLSSAAKGSPAPGRDVSGSLD